jgi:endonuclease YncB( thermonuclease family)
MYEYKCFVIRIVDGCTVDAQIDLGFNVLIRQRIKLYGINCEDIKSLNDPIRQKAIASKNRLTDLLGKEFICQTIMNKRGKAGRTLGHVFTEDENGVRIDINQKMIDEGYAITYGE